MNKDSISNFINNEKIENLSRWLEQGFINEDFSPFLLNDRSSAAVQLKYLFDILNTAQQNKFKSAVALSIQNWKLNDDPSILTDLVILTSYVDAYDTIKALENILKSQSNGDAVEIKYEVAVEKIISTLFGFAKSGIEVLRIQKLFEKLFFGYFDRRYAVQLFIGLCICNPKQYPKYLAQFFDLYEETKDLYNLDIVVKTFLHTVPPNILREEFISLGFTYQDKLKNIAYAKPFFDFNEKYTSSAPQAKYRVEDSRRIKRELMSLENKKKLIETSLDVVKKKLYPQVVAIYLFSKEGNLYRAGISGVDSQSNLVKKWFEEPHYSLSNKEDESFIVRAAKNEESQFLNYFEEEALPKKIWDSYSEVLGGLRCGMAFPLDGKNRTYGVLVIMNKIDQKTGNIMLNSCAFSDEEYSWFSEISSLIAIAMSSFHRGEQDKLENDLSKLLVADSPKEKVYQEVVKRLTSENTGFKACVLRLKNEKEELEVIEVYAHANNDEEREKILSRRINRAIRPEAKAFHSEVEKYLKPEKFLIDESTIGKFSENQKWVRENKFKSFGCFPLVAGDDFFGTISLYSAYDYNFYSSYDNFLERVTTLLASFILRVKRGEQIENVIAEEIGHIKEIVREENFGKKKNQINQELENLAGSLASISIGQMILSLSSYSSFD
jgi:GAF domain-containing protein